MQRAYGVYLDSYGRPINGATVSVYQSGTSTLASIYSATGDPSAPSGQANPFTTDATGFWGFSAAIGRYDIVVSSTVAATRNYPNVFLSDVGGPYLANPMTTQGDMIAGGLAGAVTRVPGNATATPMYVYSANGALPVFKQVAASEVSGLAAFIAANGVASFNGRIGTVLPAANDYTFAQLASKPTTIAGYGITDTLTNTFNGRSGTVVPASGDYSVAQVTGAAPLASPTFTGTVTAPTFTSTVGGSQLSQTGTDASPFALTLKNLTSGSFWQQGAAGSTANGVASWINGVIIEGVPTLSGNTILGTYTNSLIFQVNGRAINALTIAQTGAATFSSTVTATSFSGAGTGLTGTAASLTAGNATTATTATAANGLNSATTTVNLSAATAPTVGQVPTATSGTAATWQTPGSSLAFATQTSTAPTATSSTTLVMMGLACSFTPGLTGRVVFIGSGQMQNSNLNDGATVQLYYGTGTPPINGAALPGPAVGIAISQTHTSLVAGDSGGWSFVFPVNTLTVGTTYWLDVALKAVTAGNASVTGVTLAVFER